MRVLVFGESIALGLYDSEGGWVARLRRHYDQQKIKNPESDQPKIFNLGVPKNRTEDVLNRFANETKVRQAPDEELLFIFAVGNNDSPLKGGKPRSETDEYQDELEKLIAEAQKISKKILMVGLLPVEEHKTMPISWNTKFSYTNERLLMFDKVMREVGYQKRIPHIALFEPFDDKIRQGQRLFFDGLHPNDEGHKLIFQLLRPVLDELVGNK